MKILKPLLAGILVAFYGALACGTAGALITFWMWGFGGLVTTPLGLIGGVILGWRWPLRDAVILFAGCGSTLAAANWIGYALEAKPFINFAVPIALIFLSGVLAWVVKVQLSLTARYIVARVLVGSLVFNVAMMGVIRS